MCISSHEMTTAEIEREIAALHEWSADSRYANHHRLYATRIEQLEKVLKDRADEGTL